jgi:FkbM family methyltransferase
MTKDNQFNFPEGDIIIYGASITAKRILHSLSQRGDVNILGIAVTDIEKEPDKRVNDVKVSQIDDFIGNKSTATVLIATLEKFHQEIKAHLTQLGFTKIIPLTYELVYEFLARRLKEDYKLDFDTEVMDVFGVKVHINDFGVADNRLTKFSTLNAIGEFFLTSEANDYNYVIEGPYEHEKVQLSKNDIVFDCGANIGAFSAYAASKGCIVHAFEPIKALHPTVEKNISENGKGAVWDTALSDGSTESIEFTEFTQAIISSGISMIIPSVVSNAEFGVTTTIPCISIDDFVKRENVTSVDFIKADIEGAERLMLAGAKETLRNFAPKLAICTYHFPDDPEVLEKIIMEANPNYRVIHKWKKLYAYVEKN